MFPLLDSQFFVNWNESQVGMRCPLNELEYRNAAHPDPTTPSIQEKKKLCVSSMGQKRKDEISWVRKERWKGWKKKTWATLCVEGKRTYLKRPLMSEMLTGPPLSLIPTFREYKPHVFTKGSASIKEDFIFSSAEQRLHSLHSNVPSNTVILLYS